MIPVVVTARARNLRHPHRQIQAWTARSQDGEWIFERLEDTGSRWHATHLPSGFSASYGSLPKARRAVHAELGFALALRLTALAAGA